MSEEVDEELVDALAREYLTKLVDKLYDYVVSYLKGALKHFGRRFLMKPTLEVSIDTFEYGVEMHLRIFFDNFEVEKLREGIRKRVRDNRLRLKSFADIVDMRIRGTGDELHALLSGVRPSPAEGSGENRVHREEVRSEEGGSVAQGADEGD
jgi:hypothetical protein